MKPELKEFIREHLDLIDNNEWDKFYDIVSLNENFKFLYQRHSL